MAVDSPISHVSYNLLLLLLFYLSQTQWSIATYENTQTHIDTQKQQNNQQKQSKQ